MLDELYTKLNIEKVLFQYAAAYWSFCLGLVLLYKHEIVTFYPQ